jgi:hypothetical protein
MLSHGGSPPIKITDYRHLQVVFGFGKSDLAVVEIFIFLNYHFS